MLQQVAFSISLHSDKSSGCRRNRNGEREREREMKEKSSDSPISNQSYLLIASTSRSSFSLRYWMEDWEGISSSSISYVRAWCCIRYSPLLLYKKHKFPITYWALQRIIPRPQSENSISSGVRERERDKKGNVMASQGKFSWQQCERGKTHTHTAPKGPCVRVWCFREKEEERAISQINFPACCFHLLFA